MSAKKNSPLPKIHQLIGKKVSLREKLFPGKHSTTRAILIGNKRFVLKRMSTGKGLNFQDALMLSKAIQQYQKELSDTGLNTPKVILANPIKEANGTYRVCTLDEQILGKTIYEHLKATPKREALQTYTTFLMELSKVFGKNSIPNAVKTQTFIDSHPSNFIINKTNGKIYYVDFYTPKLKDPNGQLTPFIPSLHDKKREALQSRFGDKRGIFFIALTKAISARPELKKDLEQATIKFLTSLGETKTVRFLMHARKQEYLVPYLKGK